MATNHHYDAGPGTEEASVLGDRTRSDDPLAFHVAEALATVEDPAARYHLREALQYRLTEQGPDR